MTVAEASRQFMATAQRLPTLFDLEDTAYQLLALLEATDDPVELADVEAVAEVKAQLALVDQLMLQKQESYVSVIRSLEAMADARKAEADRLRDRAKTAERHADWLRARLLTHMQTTGRERIETSRFTLTIRQNPPSVTVLDAAAVPHEFERTKWIIDVDKRAILAHVKATGEIVPGVSIQRGDRLDIK
jgi:phage host-nuclease inhibitor protein Gam